MQSRKGAASTDHKPYRPNVGIALFNAAGQVLIGRRFRASLLQPADRVAL